MARLSFIENRGKTAFWAAVARELARRGHRIGWIVQNPVFTPSDAGETIVLPFRARGAAGARSAGDAPASDRGRAYFQSGAEHYGHYRDAVGVALDRLAPDAVVGEPTLFHEQIAIDQCRARRIPYLHPTMSRYPGERFSIFQSDTQDPVAGSGEEWTDERARSFAESVVAGRARPSYMRRPPAPERARRAVARLGAHARVWRGRLAGERFNTPSLTRKILLDMRLRANLARWRALERLPDPGRRALLYPLQMQPEANIDVWGRPFSDQVAVIRRMLEVAPQDVSIAIKANPKSKYELSDELLELAADRRVVLLPLTMPMPDAHRATAGAVTVSGTVGLEAVFGIGRCISLRHPLLAREFPSFHADGIDDAVERLLGSPDQGVGDAASGARLVRQMVRDSFPGTVNEPLYDRSCMSAENVARVADAVELAVAVATRRERITA